MVKESEAGSVRDDPEDATTLHVRRALSGDERSLAWVVERFSPLLVAQAAYRMGTQLCAAYEPEDVVQDVWIRTLPKLEQLTKKDEHYAPALLAYLSRAVLNRVNSLMVKHIRVRMARSDGTAEEAPLELVKSDATGAITRAIRVEQSTLVKESIGALEERDREILLLRGVEQRGITETSELLTLSPAAVAQRFSRALKRLRMQFPGSLFEELAET